MKKFICILSITLAICITSILPTKSAHADATPFIGEIEMFAGTFAPRGWAFCNGQLLSLSDSSTHALYSLIGTTYGGDGRTTFALPDLRGRTAIHSGNGSQGPGLTRRPLGQKSGTETVTLNEAQIPAHSHTTKAINSWPNSNNPTGSVLAKTGRAKKYRNNAPADVTMDASSGGDTGGSQAHNNMPPFLAINYIIALTGVYPSRN